LPELAIDGGSVRWPEATARLGNITVSKPQLDLWLDADGNLNLTSLLPAAADPSGAGGPPEAEPATADDPLADWDISLGELRLENLLVALTDQSLAEPGRLQLDSISLTVNELSNREGAAAPLALQAAVSSGGRIAVEGSVTLFPAPLVTAGFEVGEIALNALQPWVQEMAYVAIDSGLLSVTGSFSSTPAETLAMQADIDVAELQVALFVRRDDPRVVVGD